MDNVVSACGACDFPKKPEHSVFVQSLQKLVLLNEQNSMPYEWQQLLGVLCLHEGWCWLATCTLLGESASLTQVTKSPIVSDSWPVLSVVNARGLFEGEGEKIYCVQNLRLVCCLVVLFTPLSLWTFVHTITVMSTFLWKKRCKQTVHLVGCLRQGQSDGKSTLKSVWEIQ